MEQAFIKNPDITIADFVKSKIAELGENLVVRRFEIHFREKSSGSREVVVKVPA